MTDVCCFLSVTLYEGFMKQVSVGYELAGLHVLTGRCDDPRVIVLGARFYVMKGDRPTVRLSFCPEYCRRSVSYCI